MDVKVNGYQLEGGSGSLVVCGVGMCQSRAATRASVHKQHMTHLTMFTHVAVACQIQPY